MSDEFDARAVSKFYVRGGFLYMKTDAILGLSEKRLSFVGEDPSELEEQRRWWALRMRTQGMRGGRS